MTKDSGKLDQKKLNEEKSSEKVQNGITWNSLYTQVLGCFGFGTAIMGLVGLINPEYYMDKITLKQEYVENKVIDEELNGLYGNTELLVKESYEDSGIVQKNITEVKIYSALGLLSGIGIGLYAMCTHFKRMDKILEKNLNETKEALSSLELELEEKEDSIDV